MITTFVFILFPAKVFLPYLLKALEKLFMDVFQADFQFFTQNPLEISENLTATTKILKRYIKIFGWKSD